MACDKSICIYIHLKPKGEVFYVGIGSKKRAYDNYHRNNFWKKTVKKYGYEIQILKSDLTWKDACDLEKILISYYGRRDLKKGTLCNLTDGGEGAFGHIKSEEAREKIRQANLGDKNAKTKSKKVICTETGIIYNSILIASKDFGVGASCLRAMLRGQNRNKTTLKYL